MSDLHDITYRLPGGLALTYSTTLPTFPARLRHTIGGGIAIWRMWLREAGWMMLSGQLPYPSVISLKIAGDFERAFMRFKREVSDV